MTDELIFTKVCGPDNSKLDIIFVHGLTGDPKGTWTVSHGKKQEDVFWPEWICEKFPEVSIYTLGYPSSIFEKWAKKEMDIFERAENALEYMASQNIGNKPIVFVCHSLGGVLVKQILRTGNDSTDDDWKKISQETRLITFLGTPHTGASLASILKFVFPKLTSSHIDALTKDDGYLNDLNKFYRDFAPEVPIKTVVYYEKHKTKNVSLCAGLAAE
ncbi:MAG: hypothetical protein DYH13_05280 [Alphaproteobacteria bacterium PRO2]|nr:hypothetical protein [Alphaproteobacteria bacterium PRO2]